MTSIARVEVQRIEGAPLPRPLHLAWDPGVVKTTDSFTVVRVFDVEGRMGVGEGGRQERAAAARYERLAGLIADSCPRSARLLREMADDHRQHAVLVDHQFGAAEEDMILRVETIDLVDRILRGRGC